MGQKTTHNSLGRLRATTGSYILVLFNRHPPRSIPIGRLGGLTLQPGYYLYVGSAFGSGGVASRVNRHRKTAKPCRWHIDYLRRFTRLDAILVHYGSERLESCWVRQLLEDERLSTPLTGFGASDSPHPSHLFYCEAKLNMEALARSLSATRDAITIHTLGPQP